MLVDVTEAKWEWMVVTKRRYYFPIILLEDLKTEIIVRREKNKLKSFLKMDTCGNVLFYKDLTHIRKKIKVFRLTRNSSITGIANEIHWIVILFKKRSSSKISMSKAERRSMLFWRVNQERLDLAEEPAKD